MDLCPRDHRAVTPPQLPDYKRPPVVQIIAAVQFMPLPRFAMPEVIAVARAFESWRIVDAPPALPPIVEMPPGDPPHQSFNLALGAPPMRLVLASDDGRWLLQLQQDRLAVHAQQAKQRPSYAHVQSKLTRVVKAISETLERPILKGEHRPELVELIYENRVPVGEELKSLAELGGVLRVVASRRPPSHPLVEEIGLRFSSVLEHDGIFAGRLRVQAEPGASEGGHPELHLQLNSRRYVSGRPLKTVLDECHVDIVEGFTEVTTERMHKIWGRLR